MTFPVIANLDLIANVFPIGAALRRLSTRRRAALAVAILFFGSLVTELLTRYLGSRGTNNHPVLNVYNIFEFLIVFYYFHGIEQSRRWKLWQDIAAALFVVFWLTAKSTFEPMNIPAEYTHTASAGLLAIFAVRSLVQLMTNEELILYRDERFWISIATFFYFFTNVIMYGYMDAFTHLSIAQAIHFWKIHWSLSVAAKLTYAFAFIWTPRT